MRRSRIAGLLVACAPLTAGCDRLPIGSSDVIALEGATLIDGSGGRPVPDAVVLVRGHRIAAVARVNEVSVPRGATRLDLVGKTIIPGLIDAHARLEAWSGPLFVSWGVTTVRDLREAGDGTYRLRADFNGAAALGPRVFTAGGSIDGAPAALPGADAAATTDQARRAVDRRALDGAEWIQVYTKVTPDLLAAIIDEAATLRLPAAARLGKTDALTAARAGVASIESLSGVAQAAGGDPGGIARAHDDLMDGWRAEARVWVQLDSPRIARVARALAETRASIVPTLVAFDALARLADSAFLERRAMADVPSAAGTVRDAAGFRRRLGWTPADGSLFAAGRRNRALFLREFRRAGGLMGAGSGAAGPLLIPGFSLHEELALLVEAGFAPLSVIATATRRNAQLLRADSLGWIAPGKVADLVILDARPDSSILATRGIYRVMLRGRLIDPDSLRATWQR